MNTCLHMDGCSIYSPGHDKQRHRKACTAMGKKSHLWDSRLAHRDQGIIRRLHLARHCLALTSYRTCKARKGEGGGFPS